jgi:Protein of unknown function (DUF3379)
MNDIDARRQLLADPRRISPQLQAQVDSAPALAALRDELLRTDDEMRRELTRPEVPEGLADRIVLRARYGDRSRRGLALAASVVAFGVAISGYFVSRGPALERAMIEHVAEEVDELRDNPGIEPAVLRASVATLGVEVRDAGYRIRHLANCIVAGREGRHFTIDGPHGVVSFVILPGVSRGGPESMQVGSTQGRFLKRAGATIGVFAQGDASPAELETLMRRVFA